MNRLLGFILGGLGVMVSGVGTALDTPVTETSEGEPIATYEKTLALKASNNLAFSFDGRYLAYIGHYYTLRIADLETGDVRILAKDMPTTHLAWSPDGRYLAVAQSGQVSAFRLFNTATGIEIGRREPGNDRKIDGYHVTYGPLAFTADGQSFWTVNSHIQPSIEPWFGVLKISVPDLKVVDTVPLSPPVPGKQAIYRNSRFQFINGKLSLTLLAGAYVNKNEVGTSIIDDYVYALELDSKASLISASKVESNNQSKLGRSLRSILIFDSLVYFIKYYSPSVSVNQTEEIKSPKYNLELDRQFETIHVNQPDQGVFFGGIKGVNELDETYAEGGVTNDPYLVLSPPVLLSRWNRFRLNKGGLVIYDPLTGKRLQRVLLDSQVRELTVSPDQKHVALVLKKDGRIRLYRINPR